MRRLFRVVIRPTWSTGTQGGLIVLIEHQNREREARYRDVASIGPTVGAHATVHNGDLATNVVIDDGVLDALVAERGAATSATDRVGQALSMRPNEFQVDVHLWYTTALPPRHDGVEENYQILDYGGFYLFIDRRDGVGDRNPEPGRMLINFDVDDASAVATRMDDLGATWLSPLEDRDGSWFGTVIDPDGNYVQIIQLSEAHKAAVESTSTAQ